MKISSTNKIDHYVCWKWRLALCNFSNIGLEKRMKLLSNSALISVFFSHNIDILLYVLYTLFVFFCVEGCLTHIVLSF